MSQKSTFPTNRTKDTVTTGHLAVYDVTGDSATLVDGGAPSAAGITQLTGDITAGPGSGSQAATIAAAAVTYGKMQDVSAASKLLGRGSAAGAGDVQEITLDASLTMTGTTLATALAIGQTIAAATAGSVLFAGTAGILQQDNANLFFDDVNNRLGINTAAVPLSPLHVVTASGVPLLLENYQASAQGAGLIARKARGTLAAPLRTKSGDNIGIYNARGGYAADDVSTATMSASNAGVFIFTATEDFTSTAQGAKFSLSTIPIGSTTSTLRITIDENGLTLADALNLITGTTTGMKIGTATTQKLGFFNATPVIQQTDGANLTNNVTAGGTTDVIANYTDLSVYATDAAAIRNDIYQLARKVKIIGDALRTYGFLS